MNRLLLVILQLSCINFWLCAQNYYFRNYEVNDGVSNNTITCIAQDQRGFMWFGTRNGLNRFDGTSFKIFRTNVNNPHSIGSNSILSLLPAKGNKLWVGTYKGIYLYDEVHESFSLFNKIPPVEVRSIKADNSGQLWIIAGDELFRYNPVTQILHSYSLRDKTVAVSISPAGSVWTASNTGLIGKYNPAVNQFTEYDMAALCKKWGPLQTICPVGDTSLLIAHLKSTFLFNVAQQKLTNLLAHPANDGIQVHTILQQSTDEFWMGAEDGLYIWNIKNNNLQCARKQYGNPYALSDNVVMAFCKDLEGSTWVGTFSGGINFYSKQLNYFKKYFPGAGSNNLSGNLVHEICADRNNNIWIGTEDAGLNKLDAVTGKISHFEPGKPGSISYTNLHGLLADGNELWVGTLTRGLDVLDLRTEKVIRHYEHDGRANWLNSNFIVTIYKTKAGDILVGTWEGLLKYNRTKDYFDTVPYFNRQTQAISEDENGTLWVCSYGNGVYYHNATTGVKGKLQHDAADNHSLPSNYVNNVFEDSRNNTWFCTENGLCRFDKLSGKVIRYTNDSLLQNNQVFRMLEDNAGMLWISTSKGLISLDPKKNRSSIYHTANGLLNEQFNYNSAFKAKDGTLYFGSVKGMISFNPASFVKTNYTPGVYITDIQVNNQELRSGYGGNQLPLAVPFTDKIQLPHDSSSISFEVAALSYTLPGMNAYMYKMEGLDHEWTYIRNNRKIYYTNLPPGDYTFQVKAAGSNGIWSGAVTSINIHILPAFWMSVWAWMLYLLIALAILFIILRYYNMAIHEKNQRKIKTLEIEKEREIYSAKIDFFTNVTHEIRTPLTLIRLPLEKLTRMTANDATVQMQLDMINKNTNRLIHLTDQLLDFRKAEANNYSLSFVRTDITGLLKDLFATYKPPAEEKKISLKLELPRISLQAYVDAEAFRKILNNLFSNAIKYAESTVIVRLHAFNSDDRVFHIECKNDGPVIPYEMKEKIFEPFYRLKETEKLPGTGIGLPLARSLAELHKGVLDLKKPINSFNSFLLSVPIHQENELTLNDYETFETENNVTDEPEAFNNNSGQTAILLVEDNKDILHFLQLELNQNYHTFKAYNGQEALEILNRENIHLVISDLMMPVMDGIELCRRIKTDIHFSHIPIIILTAKNTLTAKIEGLETGADAYIEKPFSLEHLQVQVANLLNNRNIIKDYYAHSPLVHIKGIASTKADKNFLEVLQQLIDQNITDKDLKVETLSKMMNMSRGTFYRKIKGLSNLSPNELINISRLKKAAELLAEGTYKINKVANIVGYNLNSNFSRDFHKQFGVTPSHYLKNLVKE